ncbi:helicase associated domain-containing protein [Streptomyces sp. NPDC001828]|uniref:helicase associated domain-containing protein n=1 Tax=Streptomyces sp. NPDC001828 TaxID=3364615 RepID=UPI0036BA6EC0
MRSRPGPGWAGAPAIRPGGRPSSVWPARPSSPSAGATAHPRRRVPRKRIERIVGEDQEERKHKLGAWISNQRSRAVALTPDRTEQLSAIGMRWV